MSSTRVIIQTFGGFTGLMGIEHGVGEILQGNQHPSGYIFESWPNSAFFRILSGEPAFTLLPNLLAAGILTCLFSGLFLVTALFFPNHRRSVLALVCFAILMFLTGGGIFPPFLGLLIAAIASRLNLREKAGWKNSALINRFLGALWPWVYFACLMAWLAMVPGVPVMNTFFGVENEAVIFTILGCMFVLLALSSISAIARDTRQENY